MAIQFQCPQGHLLQGDEAHMGMQTQCPYCATMFIIPVVDVQALHAAGQAPATQYPHQYMQPGYAQQGAYTAEQSYLPQELHNIYDPTATQPGLNEFLSQATAGEVADPVASQAAAFAEVAAEPAAAGVDVQGPVIEDGEPASTGFLHIPCPNGHELETPPEMLGQEVLCPHCNAQFFLRHQDSREYQAKQEQIDIERGKFWFNWAIAAAVLVGSGLVALVLAAVAR